MFEYVNNLVKFCNNYPLWSAAFFICGFLIGEVYF